jgi:S-formylglutathione hydrolase FrmB
MRIARAFATVGVLGVAILVGTSAPVTAQVREQVSHFTTFAAVNSAIDEGAANPLVSPDVRDLVFRSETLGRTMPYSIYLPPDYATSAKRYPVLYMLHGMSGTKEEWAQYGIFTAADRMIRAHEIRPLIIVLPQGDQAYWVDHALPTDKEAWGRYMARDVVASVDSQFRTMNESAHRAIGGVSMGAHGAMQLAMNFPNIFSVVGAHSLVLRRYDTAPAYFGSLVDWAKRDPMQLVYSTAQSVKRLDLWIDIGKDDPWAKLAEQFNGELASLKIDHEFHMWSGDHSASYWQSHLADYLRFYDSALRTHQSPVPSDPAGLH